MDEEVGVVRAERWQPGIAVAAVLEDSLEERPSKGWPTQTPNRRGWFL